MNTIRLATVGTGYFSQFQYAAWRRIPEVDLVAVCNRTIEGAQKTAEKYEITSIFSDFSEMLEHTKPDLVDIITPPETHLDYIKVAVEHAVAIICQKPFCNSLEEAEVAIQLAKEAGVTLVIHENFRFQPWYQEISKQIQTGILGDIYQAQFRLRPGDGQGADAYLARQPYFQKMERFLIHETGIHWVDTFRYLFGEIHSVYAHLRQLNPVIAGEDSGLIIFEFKSGIQVVFDGNRLADHSAENRRLTMGEMLVEGSEGAIQLNGDGEIFFRKHGHNTLKLQKYDWKNIDFGGDCVYNLQKHVIDYLLGQGELVNTAESYMKNLIVEKAIYSSAEKQQQVIIE